MSSSGVGGQAAGLAARPPRPARQRASRPARDTNTTNCHPSDQELGADACKRAADECALSAARSDDEADELALARSSELSEPSDDDGSVCSCCCYANAAESGDNLGGAQSNSRASSDTLRSLCQADSKRASCSHSVDALATGRSEQRASSVAAVEWSPARCSAQRARATSVAAQVDSAAAAAAAPLAAPAQPAGQHSCDGDAAQADRNETRASEPDCQAPTETIEAPVELTAADEQERELALLKRRYVLAELVDTERDYVGDLGKIVEGYLEEIRRQLVDSGVDDILTTGVVPGASAAAAQAAQVQAGADEPAVPSSPAADQYGPQQQEAAQQQQLPKLPEALKDGKHKIIFGNIEAIYEFHRDHFLHELERCLDEPQRLGPLFKRYERRLNMYVVYCQNKPRSEAVLSEHLDTYFEELRIKLGHKLQLPDLLIKPVQRIMKYQLLLKDVLRYTERAQLAAERADLMRAVEIMLVVPKAADDMMNVGRLQGFPGKLTAQGKLIKQGILLFCDISALLAGLEPAHQLELLASCAQSSQRAAQEFEALSGEQPAPSARHLLSSSSIGSSRMSNSSRLILNKLLSASGSGSALKMRERQTFLFEQTIIFSEVLRKGSTMSSLSTTALSGPASSASNFHPCTAHSHSAQGAVEWCCCAQDCALPATGAPCDRLFGAHQLAAQQQQVGASASSNTTRLSTQSVRRVLGERLRSHRDSVAFLASRADTNQEQASAAAASAAAAAEQHQQQTASGDEATSPGATLGAPSFFDKQRHHHHALGVSAAQAHAPGAYLPPPCYEYKNHLSINKVALIDKHYGPGADLDSLASLFGPALDLDVESRRFMLKSRDPNQENVIFLLQAGCSLDRDDWVNSICSMLECQLDFLRALQSPIAYQRGLTKEGSTPPELTSLWNPELRKTLSNPPNSNKFHKRIPSLFSAHSANQRGHTGSVKVPGADKGLPPQHRQAAGSLTSAATATANQSCASSSLSSSAASSTASTSTGNAKYLRYVRSKLSKSRLNSVLSLTTSSAGSALATPAATEQEAEADELGATARSSVGPSLSSSEPASAELDEPQQQTKSKKSTFFQGFRYTLRGRRGSKAGAKREPSNERTLNATGSIALQASAQLSGSQSLSSISGASASAGDAQHQQQQLQASVMTSATEVRTVSARVQLAASQKRRQTTTAATADSTTHKLLHLVQRTDEHWHTRPAGVNSHELENANDASEASAEQDSDVDERHDDDDDNDNDGDENEVIETRLREQLGQRTCLSSHETSDEGTLVAGRLATSFTIFQHQMTTSASGGGATASSYSTSSRSYYSASSSSSSTAVATMTASTASALTRRQLDHHGRDSQARRQRE